MVKINLSSDANGFITYLSIEDSIPNDVDRFLPVIDGHLEIYVKAPSATASDGCYACLNNTSSQL
jgi:IS5 family transposase